MAGFFISSFYNTKLTFSFELFPFIDFALFDADVFLITL